MQVYIGNVSQGTFKPTGRIIVFGQAGNDTIALAPLLTIRTELYGGDGTDVISGDAGYIAKPFTPEGLVTKVNELLGDQSSIIDPAPKTAHSCTILHNGSHCRLSSCWSRRRRRRSPSPRPNPSI